jgi:hypothetical protein
MNIDNDTLKRIGRLARKRYNSLPEYCYNHPSHAAEEALAFAASLCGHEMEVQGFALNQSEGYHYLNTGDIYDQTVICHTTSYSARFFVGCIGDIMEKIGD